MQPTASTSLARSRRVPFQVWSLKLVGTVWMAVPGEPSPAERAAEAAVKAWVGKPVGRRGNVVDVFGDSVMN